MKDADDWAQALGVYDLVKDVEPDPRHLAPGAHSDLAETARVEALARLDLAAQIIASMKDSLRVFPDGDVAIDNLGVALASTCQEAGAAVYLFRTCRDCAGMA